MPILQVSSRLLEQKLEDVPILTHPFALRELLPKAETMVLNYYYRPTTSILLPSANNVDGDDGDWQDTSYTQILLLLLV